MSDWFLGIEEMIINQNEFFYGLPFEKAQFEYSDAKWDCYKGKDNCYYRIGYFSTYYVIEFAESEENARQNIFEDIDLYEDSLPRQELIKKIQADLIHFSA